MLRFAAQPKMKQIFLVPIVFIKTANPLLQPTYLNLSKKAKVFSFCNQNVPGTLEIQQKMKSKHKFKENKNMFIYTLHSQ